MRFRGGKLPVLRMSSSMDSGRAESPKAGSAQHTDPRRHHRKRRFHVHPRALGLGFIGWGSFAATPTGSSMESTPPTATTDQESEQPSDLDIIREPARGGLRICAWAAALLMVWLCREHIADMLLMAGDVMPPYRVPPY